MTLSRLVAVCTIPLAWSACDTPSLSKAESLEGSRWRLDSIPTAAIGQIEGPPEYLFDGVGAARFLGDEQFFVVDRGSATLRIYRLDGTFIRQFGGMGEGPGEFAAIWDAWISPPDTIHAVDFNRLRVTSFLSDGTVLKTRSISPAGTRPEIFRGAFSDGSLLISWVDWGEYLSRVDGVVHIALHNARFHEEGTYVGEIGASFPMWWYWRADSDAPVGTPGGLPTLHPLSPAPELVVHRDTVFQLDGVRPQVSVWTSEGEPVRIIPLPARELSPAEGLLRLAEALPENRTDRLGEVPSVDSIPNNMGLLMDDEGLIWTKRYDPVIDSPWVREGRWFETRGGDWWVVDREGQVRASVEIPDSLIVRDVRHSRVLAVTRDALGVEGIVVFRIEKH